jgi:hypothetical protein
MAIALRETAALHALASVLSWKGAAWRTVGKGRQAGLCRLYSQEDLGLTVVERGGVHYLSRDRDYRRARREEYPSISACLDKLIRQGIRRTHAVLQSGRTLLPRLTYLAMRPELV